LAIGAPPCGELTGAIRQGTGSMTTLVTGATGFLGSAVLRALLERGETVRALVRPHSSRRNLDGLAVEIAQGDLADRRSLSHAVRGCQAVFHVAADYRLWAAEPAELYRTNLDGTRALLEAAGEAGVPRIVYTSSVATLGSRPDGEPADESTPSVLDQMVGHYKRSKFLAEQAARKLAGSGLPVVIVNPSAPIGPRDIRPTPTGRMVLEAARGHFPASVDTGLNVVHVDDAARGHLLAFERGRIGQRYVLGGENLPLGEILAMIARLVGRRAPRLRLPPGLLLPLAHLAESAARLSGGKEPLLTTDGLRMARKRMYFSSALAASELGFRSRPALNALRDALDWYRRHGYL
jgi:dihydroflavonol-4-reductase